MDWGANPGSRNRASPVPEFTSMLIGAAASRAASPGNHAVSPEQAYCGIPQFGRWRDLFETGSGQFFVQAAGLHWRSLRELTILPTPLRLPLLVDSRSPAIGYSPRLIAGAGNGNRAFPPSFPMYSNSGPVSGTNIPGISHT